jgi:Barstar (barnase inhibitor)
MQTITVDCEAVRAIPTENAHYFGRNLDALWDAVSGGGPGAPQIARTCTTMKIILDDGM